MPDIALFVLGVVYSGIAGFAAWMVAKVDPEAAEEA